jgi:carbonic anhydrase
MADWDYGDERGPAAWAGLDPSFSTCATGKRQSPIDLRDARETQAEPIRALYQPVALRLAHDGHTVRAHPAEPQTLRIGSKEFALAELHFHTPSEHALEGALYAAEAHFVHRADDGELAVLGILLEPGEANAAFDALEPLPPDAGDERTTPAVDLRGLLPANLTAFRYAGSLTTPPCTEGVRWSVADVPVQLSEAQLGRLHEILGFSARPLQPRNERELILG